MTLDIPFANGFLFVTIFLPRAVVDVIAKTFKYRQVLPACCWVCFTPVQLLGTSASIHWALFKNHGWSTLCKYSISPVRLSLLQGFHWEHRYFAQGARDGVSGVKDNIFSYSLTMLNPSRDGAPTTSLGSQFQYFPTFTVRNFFLELSLKYSLLVYSYSPLSYHHLPP